MKLTETTELLWLSVTCVRKLSSVEPRKFLNYLCSTALTLQQIPGWLKTLHEGQGRWKWSFFQMSEDLQIFSEADLLFPKHIFCRRHLSQHHSCACHPKVVLHASLLDRVTNPFPHGQENLSPKAKGWAVLLLGGGRNSTQLCSLCVLNTSVVLPYIGQWFPKIARNRQSVSKREEYKVAGWAGRFNLYRTAEPEDETGCKNKEIQAYSSAIFHDL